MTSEEIKKVDDIINIIFNEKTLVAKCYFIQQFSNLIYDYQFKENDYANSSKIDNDVNELFVNHINNFIKEIEEHFNNRIKLELKDNNKSLNNDVNIQSTNKISFGIK